MIVSEHGKACKQHPSSSWSYGDNWAQHSLRDVIFHACNQCSCIFAFTYIRSDSTDLLLIFWDCLVWKGKTWKVTSKEILLPCVILWYFIPFNTSTSTVSRLGQEKTLRSILIILCECSKGFITWRNLGGRDKCHLTFRTACIHNSHYINVP